MDLGHSVEPWAVGGVGVVSLVAPLGQTAVKGRLCCLLGHRAAEVRIWRREGVGFAQSAISLEQPQLEPVSRGEAPPPYLILF